MNSSLHPDKNYRIGFVSTRFSGTDGVSLETDKWVTALELLGYPCYFFAGSSDQPPDLSYIVPEASFTHPDIRKIYRIAFSQKIRPPEISRLVKHHQKNLVEHLTRFVREFRVDLLISENALTIPMNIPLGLALTEFIAETGFPTIAHHHDFYWERQRFLTNCVGDYLSMAFPPSLPSIFHVVINTLGGSQLSLRTGISSMLIPNVMDFENPPAPPDEFSNDLRASLELKESESLVLQPTRVVQRKGIEHAIELIKRLEIPARLVISHASGDELDDYEKRLKDYAELLGVPVNFVAKIIQQKRGYTEHHEKIYALEDVYLQADLVTYPSTMEGFGNAFLEAIYYMRPIVVNTYSIFDLDIKPKGFSVIEFEGYITDETVKLAREVLENKRLTHSMTEHNFELGKRYYSYSMLTRHLKTLLADIFGEFTRVSP